jgi:5-formyltetrahydrofolate cyclo-ligase
MSMSGPDAKQGCNDDAADDEPRDCASPPCSAHELDPNYGLDDRYPILHKDRPVCDRPASSAWRDVRVWRKAQRSRLLRLRTGMDSATRARLAARIQQHLDNASIADPTCVAFYWPLEGEFDPRPLIVSLLARGSDAALAVITERDQPMEFWQWQPDTAMCTGPVWGIPRPRARTLMAPSTILVPLLGFDASGYRLGHGGGYYDRTLARAHPKPSRVGIGYDFGRLATIHPQNHDVPMDVIVTESGIVWRSDGTQMVRID